MIAKLNEAQTDEISSSILFEILYALKIFCLNIGILIELINCPFFNFVFR